MVAAKKQMKATAFRVTFLLVASLLMDITTLNTVAGYKVENINLEKPSKTTNYGSCLCDLSDGGEVSIYTSGSLIQESWAFINLPEPFTWIQNFGKFTMDTGATVDVGAYSKLFLYPNEEAELTLKSHASLKQGWFTQIEINEDSLFLLDESAVVSIGTYVNVLVKASQLYVGPAAKLTVGNSAVLQVNSCDGGRCSIGKGGTLQMDEQSRLTVDVGGSFLISDNGAVHLQSAAALNIGITRSQLMIDESATLNLGQMSRISLDGGFLSQSARSALILSQLSSVRIESQAKLSILPGITLNLSSKSTLDITDGLLCLVSADTMIYPSENFTISLNSERPSGFKCFHY